MNPMRAVWYEKGGPAAEVLHAGETGVPAPAPGEVLIRVHASGVNPSDVKNRSGVRGAPPFARIIPHSDGAGVIEAAGEGVDAARIGERVYICNAQFKRPFGTCAEYCAAPAAMAVPLPENLSFAEGACLGIPAMTAHRCVFADGPVAGQTVLVTGGAGTVGRLAVQFAKRGGAHVIATVSGPEKAAHAASAGADATVNYKQGDAIDAILEATGGCGVDRIVEVEFGGNLAQTRGVLKPNGIVAAYGSAAAPEPALPFYPMMFDAQTVRTVLVYILPKDARRAAAAGIADAAKDGALDCAIAAEYPLAQTAAAHEAVEAGVRLGAVIVTVNE
ncbi:MAG: NADPH:quinone reductase [Rhodospirillales bacterium]